MRRAVGGILIGIGGPFLVVHFLHGSAALAFAWASVLIGIGLLVSGGREVTKNRRKQPLSEGQPGATMFENHGKWRGSIEDVSQEVVGEPSEDSGRHVVFYNASGTEADFDVSGVRQKVDYATGRSDVHIDELFVRKVGRPGREPQ